jgi:pyruvate/2-oxoglutarate dehydrogenase complex dihydrolipoamide acyltransferase (E2) component
MNPNDDHAVLVCWHVASGSWVPLGTPLATLETTKATFDVHAPIDGFAFYEIEPNSLIAVGDTLARLNPDCEPAIRAPEEPKAANSNADAAPDARFTRKALRSMKQRGLSPADFPSSSDRIDVAEVERVARERGAVPDGAAASDRTPLEQTPAKIIEARTLAEVYRAAVPSTVSVAVSCEKSAVYLRNLSEDIGPISLLELVIHECAQLLADFPDLNGFHAGGRAWTHSDVAIGFAINLGKSLRVPVVRHAAQLTKIEVARCVRDLSLRYLRDELCLEDLTDGTFTISDLSQYGVANFVPVLNRQQAATLGICGERPGTRHQDLVLTFDHRMTDGMRAAQFLAELRNRIEADSQV